MAIPGLSDIILTPTTISTLPTVTLDTSADWVIIYDQTDGQLKKALIPGGGGFDFGLSAALSGLVPY